MNRIKQTLRRLMHHTGGIAAVEFAISFPVLLTLFYGSVEITRFVLVTQKVEKLAHAMADVTAQSATVTNASLDQAMAAATDIMNPYAMGANGRIMINSIYRAPGTSTTPRVMWRYSGGGSLTATSAFGTVGGTPTLPTGFTLDERENVIVTEVFFRFSPLLTDLWFGSTTVYRTAFYKPRYGALLTTPS